MNDIVVLTQTGKRQATVNRHPECRQVLGEHTLGLGLRGDECVWERAVDTFQRYLEHLLAPGEHVHSRRLHAGGEQVVQNAHSVEHVAASGVDGDCPRFVRGRL